MNQMILKNLSSKEGSETWERITVFLNADYFLMIHNEETKEPAYLSHQ